jgi:hypothetical protein
VLLPFDDRLVVTNHFDAECSMLADRHYSRQKVGARQFMPNGRKIVIRDRGGLIVFCWLWQEIRDDHEPGYNCSLFRNEGPRRSSDVILECEGIALERWGPNRVFTYVKPAAIRSLNPGYCFKCAGWKFIREHGDKHLLAKIL